jgi:hypothetical protein
VQSDTDLYRLEAEKHTRYVCGAMAGRDTRHEQELDNWFDEPDTPGALEERSGRLGRSSLNEPPTRKGVEDSISADTPATTGGPLPIPAAAALRRGRAVLAAALIVVVCLGGLAAAGVFSGSNGKTSAAKTPTAGAPTTTTTPQVTKTQPALAAPPATLKPGDQGAAVKVLQRALAHLGYSPGTIDGQYGPSTTHAVSLFQRASGLTADGILGPNTLRALTRALKTG